jgi:hypothetical protein
MRLRTIFITTTFMATCAAAAIMAGCRSNAVDKGAFESALNNYYAGHQECLWSDPIKFPVQADTSNESQTAGFDALTDAGLLKRMPGEKQRFLIGSKQVNNYDLSDNGRSDWTADTAQPGYGNFCLGSPKVKSIDSYSPADNTSASQYAVTYRYAVSLPSWASNTEIKTAFPRVERSGDGQEASATLLRTDNGWQVQGVSNVAVVPQP